MKTSLGITESPQIAIWYFIGATFAFVAPLLLFPDAPLWVRVAFFAAGFIAAVGGGIQLGREIRQRRDASSGEAREEVPDDEA